MNSRVLFLCLLLCGLSIGAAAQVKIGTNPTTIDANSLLELESTTKGFLPPRVTLTATITSFSPLASAPPAGMLVFNSVATNQPIGYYYWDGTQWVPFNNTRESAIITKTANATLTVNETFVVASGEITLTLPAILAANDGLTITIKNVGTASQLVSVVASGTSTIDGIDTATASKHFRWISKTYVASGGNWLVIRTNKNTPDNVLEVSANSSWTTIAEALAYLAVAGHIPNAAVIKLMPGTHTISATQTINLSKSLVIEGSSSSGAASSVITGSGSMFSCTSSVSFKRIQFLSTGGAATAIALTTAATEYQVEDCSFNLFNISIDINESAEVSISNVTFIESISKAVEWAGSTGSGDLNIKGCVFVDQPIAVDLISANSETVTIMNCQFHTGISTDIGVKYTRATFVGYYNIDISHNMYDNRGTFLSGFDFTNATDANIIVMNNSGYPDQNPKCRIDVLSNATASTTNSPTIGNFVVGTWTQVIAPLNTTKWTIGTNRITYQPNFATHTATCVGTISGSLTVAAGAPKTITIRVLRTNPVGPVTTVYGTTRVYVTTNAVPFQFSTSFYATDVTDGEYFEVYHASSAAFDVITFQNLQWYTETK